MLLLPPPPPPPPPHESGAPASDERADDATLESVQPLVVRLGQLNRISASSTPLLLLHSARFEGEKFSKDS